MSSPQPPPNNDQAENSYNAFKEKVIEQLEAACHARWEDILKHYYYNDSISTCRNENGILSQRNRSSLCRSRSLAALIEILEQRDCLSADNVAELEKLAEYVKCAAAITLIDQYRKENEIERLSETICSACRQDTEQLATPSHPSNASAAEDANSQSCECQQRQNALDSAISHVSLGIGESWVRVARALRFREGDIDAMEYEADELAEKEGTERATQIIICMMFETWKKRQKVEGRTATVEKIKAALVKARRKDLAELLAHHH